MKESSAKKKTRIEDTTFIVCDVETTGMSAFHNRITEIALVKIRDEEIIDSFTTLVNPRQHIPLGITRLTGISNEDVYNKPPFEEFSDEILEFIRNGRDDNVVFTGHNVSFDYNFLRESFLRLDKPVRLELNTLCTCKLARRIMPKLRSKSLGNVAEHLGIIQNRKHRAYDDTLTTAKILLNFLGRMQDEYEYETIDEILKFQNTKIYSGEKKPAALKRIRIDLKDIPSDPGVYYMLSGSGEILYIGKAKNLRDRISSYFRHNENITFKIRKMLSGVRSLKYEVTDSELSALILESKMIKMHKPRYNTAIKRFRFHPFLKLDIQNEFPKITTVYEIENDGAYYYGPFSSRGTVRQIYKTIHENFKLRKCEDKILKASPKQSNCLYFDIGKCDAPCNITISKDIYRNEVNVVHNFITSEGKKSATGYIKTLMLENAESENYEKAAVLRDRLHDITKVLSYQKVITSAINDKKIIIKCDSDLKREIFFIHNGKLMKTVTLKREDEYNQENTETELLEIIEYLYFSLNKYTKHKYSQQELDEIKVISNWLALNRDKNSYVEISDDSTPEQLLKFALN